MKYEAINNKNNDKLFLKAYKNNNTKIKQKRIN